MNAEEAFDVLGLPLTAKEKDIKTKYRSLAKSHHSDLGGDDSRMKQLNEAREVALKYASGTRAVTLREVAELVPAWQAAMLKATERSDAVRSTEAAARSHQISPLQQMRAASVLFGVVAAGAAFILAQVKGFGLPGAALGGVVSAGAAGAALFFTARISILDNHVSTLTSELRDRGLLVGLLREITIHIGGQPFDGQDFRSGLSNWIDVQGERGSVVPAEIANLIRALGNEDSARLILAVALQVGALEEIEEEDNHGYPLIKYAIRRAHPRGSPP